MKLSKKVRAAFRKYYLNRKEMNHRFWDKQADLETIFCALPKNCIYRQAIAGTFWLTWKSPRIQTVHSENNWWTCKVLNRLKNGKWVKATKDWS